MSAALRSKGRALLPQQRWCSGAQSNDPVNGLVAAKRIARIESKVHREMLWFIQWRSMETNGLRRLAEELGRGFPERIGTPAMRRIIKSSEQRLTADEVREIRAEIAMPREIEPGGYIETLLFRVRGDEKDEEYLGLEMEGEGYVPPCYPAHLAASEILDYCWDQSNGLPEYLSRLCIDSEIKVAPDAEGGGVWYFSGLIETLCELQAHLASRAADQIAETEVSSMIQEGLDFCVARQRWILIEGLSGVGKSHIVKAWCAMHAGHARYVEVPSSNDERGFFSAIAVALGVAPGTYYNAQNLRLRIEAMLKESGLFLVLDEAQFLIPQRARPEGIPHRLQWLKTAFDAGTPIAMIGLPDFSKWQAHYVKKTMWSDEQLERRLNRKIRLPAVQSKEDFIEIAKAQFPEGTESAWRLLAGCALTSVKKQASAITEALESARYRAEQDGRELVTFDDIEAVIREVHIPSEHGSGAAPPVPATATRTVCKPRASALQEGGRIDAGGGESFESGATLRGVRPEMPARLASRADQTGLPV
jgi:hypothetical protein